jgi:GWxTD domain-containing protein
VPATDRNEREEEYFARISYAEEKFRHGDRGYRSDRGRVYVVYGPPDQVESRPFELDTPAYEVWSYYGSGRSFTFVDRYGTGQFVLVSAGG